MHGRLLSPLTLVVLLAAAPPATAGGSQGSENFTARISGTYTTSGTVTNTKCRRVDEQDNEIPFTATGEASESVSFRATRGRLFAVSRDRGGRLSAGGPAIPVTARLTRSSTLDSDIEPRGCSPYGPPLRTTCGTRTRGYKLGVYGGRRGNVFSYNFIRRFSAWSPDDPFGECPLVAGQTWWGQYYTRGNGTARMPAALLFNRRVRTIKVTGGRSMTVQRSSASQGYSARSSFKLRWTLTLTRRR